MSWQPISALPAIALTAACGARSSLSSLDGAGAHASADGGAAGTPSSWCATLAPAGPDLVLGDMSGFDARRPALVALGDGRIAVVHALDPAPLPPGPKFDAPLADRALSPWGAWPPVPSDLHQLGLSGSTSFVLAPRPGTAFTVLYDLEGTNPPDGMVFAESVDVMGYAAGTLFDPAGGAALFAASLGDRHVTGVDHPHGSGFHTFTMRAFHYATPEMNDVGGACGDAPLAGAAIPSGDGALVAISSSEAFGSCDPSATPDRVELVHVSLQGVTQVVPLGGVALDGAIERLALVPRSGGAWLVAQTSGGTRAVLLDQGGMLVGPLLPAAPSGGRGLAAAPLGDGFAAAWIDDAGARLRIAVIGPDGSPAATASLALPPQALVPGSLSLVSAPDGRTLLLSWSEEAVGAAARIHLARLACAAGS